MSIKMQLRAMPESEIREDWAWLEEFMGAAGDFDRFQAERRAGTAEVVEYHFPALHEVYEAAYTLQGSPDWELPVFGGSPVYHATHDQPPFLILRPAQVREVADFLAAVSFDALWDAARPKVLPPFSAFDEAEVKGWFPPTTPTCRPSTPGPSPRGTPSSRPSGTEPQSSPRLAGSGMAVPVPQIQTGDRASRPRAPWSSRNNPSTRATAQEP
ncbi:DUF1877 family protein [Streptomyces sp. NPDC050388]|uniref:DUF1877 family protein n=1 Tax=Streptomyces sp. NPDC050388 TaxID=3155781 RepID=UPI00343B2AD8